MADAAESPLKSSLRFSGDQSLATPSLRDRLSALLLRGINRQSQLARIGLGALRSLFRAPVKPCEQQSWSYPVSVDGEGLR
jgi:hypothetical protein